MRRAFSHHVQDQELMIQELVVRFQDTEFIIGSTSSHSVIYVGEPLDSVTNVQLLDDSAAAVLLVPRTSISIVNSKDYGVPFANPPGSDGCGDGVNDAIRILNTASSGGPPPGSPVLGTSSTYGILAAAAITNSVGTAIINGDLGESPGSTVTGAFTVSGATNLGNAASLAARADALSAYTTTAALPGYVTIANALDGQSLAAGLYTFGAGDVNLAQSGNGTLTLTGSATDVYVFKTPTTLTTGAGGIPTIALGSVLASNVYWLIGSSATLNSGVSSAGTTFSGTVLADTSITASQSIVVDGRLLAGVVTGSGALTLSGGGTVGVPSVAPSIPGVSFNLNDTLILKYISKN